MNITFGCIGMRHAGKFTWMNNKRQAQRQPTSSHIVAFSAWTVDATSSDAPLLLLLLLIMRWC